MGLRQTVLICLMVIPLGLAGGLRIRVAVALVDAPGALGGGGRHRLLSRRPSSCSADLHLFGAAVRRRATIVVCGRRNRVFSQCIELLRRDLSRAGIESIGLGQWDAARSTGLTTFHTLAYVVLPQAVRNVLPDLISNSVEVVKLTSIASVVALPELLYSADMAQIRHIQQLAARIGRLDLPGDAVADRASRQPARTPDGDVGQNARREGHGPSIAHRRRPNGADPKS